MASLPSLLFLHFNHLKNLITDLPVKLDRVTFPSLFFNFYVLRLKTCKWIWLNVG